MPLWAGRRPKVVAHRRPPVHLEALEVPRLAANKPLTLPFALRKFSPQLLSLQFRT